MIYQLVFWTAPWTCRNCHPILGGRGTDNIVVRKPRENVGNSRRCCFMLRKFPAFGGMNKIPQGTSECLRHFKYSATFLWIYRSSMLLTPDFLLINILIHILIRSPRVFYKHHCIQPKIISFGSGLVTLVIPFIFCSSHL